MKKKAKTLFMSMKVASLMIAHGHMATVQKGKGVMENTIGMQKAEAVP